MYAVKLTLTIRVAVCNLPLPSYAQATPKKDTMDLYEAYEKKIEAMHKRTGQKRLDMDGFMFYTNMDTIPQDIFIIPYPLEAYDEAKTFEENFITAISQPDVYAVEEVFMSMRWTMPTLLEELKKCTSIVVESDYPPAVNGWPIRAIYGRIIFTVQEKPLIAKPMVPSITVKRNNQRYTIGIRSSDYGYAKLFRALK